MLNNIKRAGLLLVVGLSQGYAQDFFDPLLENPEVYWTNQIIPESSNSPGVLYGNGVAVTPDGMHLIVTTVGGSMSSFSAYSGEFEWDFVPPSVGGSLVQTHSKPVFATDNAESPYMVYSVIDNENSVNPRTRVVALDMDGNQLWISQEMDGIAAGSPVISDDGDFVFLTHNANFEEVGYFSILYAAQDGAVFYSMSNETSPFAPPGIFHSPGDGYYDGDAGIDNTNDMIMWCVQPKPSDTAVGTGNTFGFQFPKDFVGGGNSTTDFGYFLLGDVPRDFQGITPPTITNEGRSAYYAVSKSGYRGWVGAEDLARRHFNRAPNAVKGFERNVANPGQSIWAAPALSSDPNEPSIFGGTAFDQFMRMDHDFSNQVVVSTTSHVTAKAVVDPEDRSVYYVESDGIIHQANFGSLVDNWMYPLGFGVEGDIALSPKGDLLFVADTRGLVTALQVGDIPVTLVPSAKPSAAPSTSPTGPTAAPTVGTPAPTVTTPGPTADPTEAPTEGDTNKPVESTASPVESTASPVEPTAAPESSAAQSFLRFTLVVVAVSLLF